MIRQDYSPHTPKSAWENARTTKGIRSITHQEGCVTWSQRVHQHITWLLFNSRFQLNWAIWLVKGHSCICYCIPWIIPVMTPSFSLKTHFLAKNWIVKQGWDNSGEWKSPGLCGIAKNFRWNQQLHFHGWSDCLISNSLEFPEGLLPTRQFPVISRSNESQLSK